MKQWLGRLIFVAILMLTTVTAANATVDVDYIRVNGEIVEDNDNLRIDLGEEIDIRVKLQANGTVDSENVEVLARIVGYEYADREGSLIDVYGPFDLDAGDTDIVDLALEVPVRADKDEYELVIDVSDRRNELEETRVTLRIKGPRSGLRIHDVIFSPGGQVEAGRALLVQSRIENLGTRDIDDLKLTAEIPELNIEGSVFLDEELNGGEFNDDLDVEVTEEILLRIPQCAEEGLYEVYVTAEFDEYEEATVTETVRVTQGTACEQAAEQPQEQPAGQQRTVITPPQSQNVQIGQGGASFPVVVTNLGSSSRSYTVSSSGLSGWGIAEVSEPAFVVQPGESKITYVFVSADSGVDEGQRVFNVAVNDRTFPVVANLVQAEDSGAFSGLRRALEIGLIILVVILIILGLIVGFSRMRNDDRDDEGKTYY